MEKICMFSMVLLWSLAGSVMGCCAMAGSVVNANRRIHIPTPSPKDGDKGGAPRVEVREERRPTRAKPLRMGHRAGAGYPPLPLILVFMELRTVSAQSIERAGVIRILLRNKDLANLITA